MALQSRSPVFWHHFPVSDASVAASAPTAARTEIAVELANVTFAYDERPVLTGISMTIPRGKVVAIMG